VPNDHGNDAQVGQTIDHHLHRIPAARFFMVVVCFAGTDEHVKAEQQQDNACPGRVMPSVQRSAAQPE
jgi:hypothetical protein